MSTNSSGLNNNGCNLMGAIILILYCGLAIAERLINEVSIIWMIVGLVLTAAGSVYLFTNKEFPPQPSRVIIPAVLFIGGILPILIQGASKYSG